MKRRLFSLITTACTLCVMGSMAPVSQIAKAQAQLNYGPYTNYFLNGLYGVQFTGNVFLPAPYDAYNGPFSRNGIVSFDGIGTFTSNVWANYNGSVENDIFSGTYSVSPNGTFTLTIVNLPIPALPKGTPNVFSFNGVIVNQGHNALISLTGVSVGGQALPNIGSVITGQLISQYSSAGPLQ